jgi:hypothetical protein
MSGNWVDDDQLLLVALGDAVRCRKTVPDWFIATGKACFAWYGLDADADADADADLNAALAELAGDNALPATRAERAQIHAFTFAARDLIIELEITRHALRGQLVPPQPGELELELDGTSTLRVRADELGYFSFERTPATSFRLHCRTATNVVSTNRMTM